MATRTGLDRLFGPSVQGRIAELRRTALVATSEVTEGKTDAGAFPRRVDVLRRERSAPGNAAAGIAGTWATVAGMTQLVAHVRTAGEWRDSATQGRIVLSDSQRIVTIADVPVGGAGEVDELLTTDRLRFDDPVRGVTAWEVKQVRVRKPDGICVALVEYAREET